MNEKALWMPVVLPLNYTRVTPDGGIRTHDPLVGEEILLYAT